MPIGTAAAVAIGGGALLGAAGSAAAAGIQSGAQSRAARSAAEAQLRSTELQINEMRRQYDDTMSRLQPLMDTQYAGNEAFARMLGISDGGGNQLQTVTDRQNKEAFENNATALKRMLQGEQGVQFMDPRTDPDAIAEREAAQLADERFNANFAAGGRGAQVDPNLFGGETALDTEFGQNVANTQLYQGIENDSLVQSIQDRQLAGGSLAEDERFRFAQDTAIAGDTFETSPGYEFAVEQSNRALDRQLSRGGGNIGGRAVLEAQRRAQGLANQEYYNYAALRQRDLARQDQAAAAFQGNQRFDASRMDSAVSDARRREEGDVGRMDQAILNNQALRQNFLANLRAAGGIGGNAIGQGVSAGQQTSAGIANAYGNQGNALANIFSQNAIAQGNIGANFIGNLNNVLQGSIGNFLTANELQQRRV